MLEYFKDTLANVGTLKPDWNGIWIVWLGLKINTLAVNQTEKNNWVPSNQNLAGGSREGPWEKNNLVPRNLYWQEAGNSGGVGGVVSCIEGLWNIDRLLGGREASGAVVEVKGGQKSAELRGPVAMLN